MGAHCCDDPVRHFGAFTDELEALAQWLCECGVRVVAMESTGVYWIPLYEVLDRVGFEVHLSQPARDQASQWPQKRRARLPVVAATDELWIAQGRVSPTR